jgi:heavy metal translocating P-type ATPase
LTSDLTSESAPQALGSEGICSLCSHPLSRFALRDQHRSFCCVGCQAVYQILAVQNALGRFQDHPVFTQAVRSGLISNPELLEQIRAKQIPVDRADVQRLYCEIQEMWCPSCAELIKLILLQEKGVLKATVDYATDLAVMEYNPRQISKAELLKKIQSIGYQPQLLDVPEARAVSFSLTLRFIIAAFCAFNVMMFSYPVYASYFDASDLGVGQMLAWLCLAASLPVITYCAWPIYRRFWLSLQWGLMGMETLVTLGVAASFGLSLYGLWKGTNEIYFDTLTVIITFVLLGKIIETRAKFSAKEALIWLTRSLPKRGRKQFADGSQAYVSIKEFKPGDELVVCAGEKVVLDGEVISGSGSCDEAVMTGEAIPIHKQPGDRVMSGSLLVNGWLIIKTTATAEESLLQRLVDLVDQELGQKALYNRLVDQLTRWFVPGVVLIAALVGLSRSLLDGIAVLLIACPCAIGIAAPLAEAYLMNRLTALGIIVRNRGCLRLLGRETVFLFDKTGTVTEGKFTVLDGTAHLTPLQKQILFNMAACSTHPIAQAIRQHLTGEQLTLSSCEEIIGKGLRCTDQGKTYHLGSPLFFAQQNIPVAQSEGMQGVVTQIYFAEEGQQIAEILLGDRIRPEAQRLIELLAPAKCLLVSGDGEPVVRHVAEVCKMQGIYWGITPLQKKELVAELRRRGEVVCMIGDGLNDAPALAAAQIGVSVVNGTDISIQASDLLLTTEKLTTLQTARLQARKGQAILRQNLFWAFIYNIMGIPIATVGLMTPIFSTLAMVASSLVVLFNSQRLKQK